MSLTCDNCEDGHVYVGRLGANDPDVVRDTCIHCNGTGTVMCNSCDKPADVHFYFARKRELIPLCNACNIDWLEDAA